MLKRTERHQSSLMTIRVNISLRKPGSSSKNVCRGHCLSFQFPFILGICEETLSTQNSQWLGVGGERKCHCLGAQSFSKSILFLTQSISVLQQNPMNLKSVLFFHLWSSYLTGHWTFVNKTDDHLNAVLVLSSWAASTTIQSSRKQDPIKHV